MYRFYIILQGSVNIYRSDDEGPEPLVIDTVTEFTKLDADPDKREELIAQAFGNYIVTLGKRESSEYEEDFFLFNNTYVKKKHLFRRKRSCL